MENYKKSRGSFVDRRRKSHTFNNIFIEESSEECGKRKFSITDYLETLKKEKQDWKNILKEKETKRKLEENLCKSSPLTISSADVETYLTPDDKEFLNNKPDYLGMMELMKKYIDAVNYLKKFKSDIIDYYDKAYNELEIDKQILVEKMCAKELCNICNLKDCQRQEHKFVI